jgi:hypothetical protein
LGIVLREREIIPMGFEAGIPLIHELMDTLYKELSGLLEYFTTAALVFLQPVTLVV